MELPTSGIPKALEFASDGTAATATGATAVTYASRDAGWPFPQPLIAQTEAEHYPLDALPGEIGAAVREVLGFVQCPAALAACSALSALSLVGQALAAVRRTAGLTGPCSLYLLAVAESGERKTKCDDFFSSPIREWEQRQAELAEPELLQHAAAVRAWGAKSEGILAKIKTLAKAAASTAMYEDALKQLESEKPKAPRVPRMIYADTTPEALAWQLASAWPVAGVLSSEAGLVFGGHGMGRDSVMRNMALLNVLWDGGAHRVDRRTSESFTVQCARLTMGLAVQPETIRTFFEASKGLARGTGFAARFLIAWPESTQGRRLFKDAPDSWPSLSAFHRRTGVLLDLPQNVNERGELDPPILGLSPEAKAVWVAFHNDVERELTPTGEMADTRDVASKAADNAARLAALFHIYEHGPSGAVGAEHMRNATAIVSWHLYEARRFLGELALPRALSNALILDCWLVKHCRAQGTSFVTTREAQRLGKLRDKRKLDEALDELVEANRVRRVNVGRSKEIHVNPALLGDNYGVT